MKSKLFVNILKSVRKAYQIIIRQESPMLPVCDRNPDSASKQIYELLMDNKPCMIARFGSTELTCLSNYMAIKNDKHNIIDYIKGVSKPWWWERNIINQMQQWSGFFPPSINKIEQFCELMLNDIPEVDLLGSWLPDEKSFNRYMNSNSKVQLSLLDPYWAKQSWTKALKGKKVLVIHPFTETIKQQYKRRELLFENDLLPDFELKCIKAVQSIGGIKTEFNDWFEALEYMKNQIDKTDYDICLISAGAYGFPLAAHVKRQGKKAIHLGGSLQLLFGIRGKRWEDNTYNKDYNYASLMNQYWVRPSEEEKPKESEKVEDSCYW